MIKQNIEKLRWAIELSKKHLLTPQHIQQVNIIGLPNFTPIAYNKKQRFQLRSSRHLTPQPHQKE